MSPTYRFCISFRNLFPRKQPAMNLANLPKDGDDAKARAIRFENIDPFPNVPRALLSSFEIADYARVTGMMWPFAEKQLKSASYEVFIGGEVIWWDGKGRRQTKIVKRGTPLVLEANSIVFAQVEPIFRLPNYIAIRFNLRITHVHRGLLLGTGPLVDPGFHGKLLIPLHNLTSTDYAIDTNEALIWIEFTKTSFGYQPEVEDDLAAQRDARSFKGFPPTNDTWILTNTCEKPMPEIRFKARSRTQLQNRPIRRVRPKRAQETSKI
ncbi:hypothetical protein [Bradyrhizobium sp. ISRA463]|uniref:dCTP deaminase domain-containing protein n=1 Tax=Bradyrhizobium sp. ISRA463 TaxID=2866199 RepID=UPI002479F2F2|nr:hypothetical protein [Bradyrhizobium sp. ISRA463]WGS19240.1 hypothetical protein MTX22_33200 [Bradyrhizobium sp. ISRA463]